MARKVIELKIKAIKLEIKRIRSLPQIYTGSQKIRIIAGLQREIKRLEARKY